MHSLYVVSLLSALLWSIGAAAVSSSAVRAEDVSPFIYFSPIIGIALSAITYWRWTKGVNSYTGMGA